MVLEQCLRPFVSNQALSQRDIIKKCYKNNTFFDYYDDSESHSLEFPTTPNGYSSTELQKMVPEYTRRVHIDSPYVCELANVDLVGPNAVPITNTGYVFENCLKWNKRLSRGCLSSIFSGTPPVKSPLLQPDRKLGTVISLVGPWTHNYTHWFQDYLTRLEGLSHYRAETGEDPMLLIPSDATQWMRDALQALGWGPDKWIMWDGGRANVERLIVSWIRRDDQKFGRRHVYSPKGYVWIRDRIKENIEQEKRSIHSEYIYLSRKNMTTRRVRNEDELMNLLSNYGFKKYCPDKMSFAEQVTLFSGARVIVSPHGSGLMNQIFADNAVVIELMGKKQTITTPVTEYFNAELLGHNYACVPGEPVESDLRTSVSGIKLVLDKLI